MAEHKYQYNYTTIEQSKRLLEIGLPAVSADCYYEKDNSTGNTEYKLIIGESQAIKDNLFSYRHGYVIPCWSVGRLVEIYLRCTNNNGSHEFWFYESTPIVDKMVWYFEECVKNGWKLMFEKW